MHPRDFTAVLILAMSLCAHAQPFDPPSASVMASGLGNIEGGITLGPDNSIYFSALQLNGASIIWGRTTVGSLKWQWQPVSNSRIVCPPSISTSGDKIFVCADEGAVYGLHTATTPPGGNRQAWRFPAVGVLGAGIRNTPLYDATNPCGPTIYCQGNDAKLYAISANTGIQLWVSTSGNTSPTPTTPFHTSTWSSSPVLDHQNRVVVATSGGVICMFDRVTGLQIDEVSVRQVLGNNTIEFEAAIAVGPNGWIYAATRRYNSADGLTQKLIAVDFSRANPDSNQLVFNASVPTSDVDAAAPGVIGGVILDRMGFVYVTEFGHQFVKFNAITGALVSKWTSQTMIGKLCATPSLTEDGIALVPMSDVVPSSEDGVDNWGLAAVRTCAGTGDDSPLLWNWKPSSELGFINLVGSPAVRSDGTIIIGDSEGRLWKLNAKSRLLVNGWPTLQNGNTRGGVGKPITTICEELPAYYMGDPALNTITRLDQAGRALGSAHGYPLPNPGGPFKMGAIWDFGTVKLVDSSSSDAINVTVNGSDWRGTYVGGRTAEPSRKWEGGVPSGYSFLPVPVGFHFTYSFATAVGEDGMVVGFGPHVSGFNRVAWWRKNNGVWTAETLDFAGGGNAQANGVTSDGRICGKAQFAGQNSTYTAFLTGFNPFTLGSVDNLGSTGGASEALETSTSGGTVGWSDNGTIRVAFRIPPSPAQQAVLGNTLQSLGGTASEAWGVNCLGQTVGRSKTSAGQWQAVRWLPGVGVPVNLNTPALAAQGWSLEHAVSITDQGIIAGYGKKNGQPRVWMLRPQL